MVKSTFILQIDGIAVNNELISSIVFEDRAGEKSDKVTINAFPNFPKPRPYAKLTLTLVRGVEILKCGTFHIQTVSRINNKGLRITATGVEFGSKQKDKKSFHYQKTKLSSIVKLVAKRLGYKVKFKIEDENIESLYQTNESDINFLERLSQKYNAVFSIKNSIVYFVSKDDESLPLFLVDVSKCDTSTITHTHKTFYNSCEATFYSSKVAKNIKVKVGDKEPLLKIRSPAKTIQEAKRDAKKALQKAQKGVVRGSLECLGKKIYAGCRVQLINTYNHEDDKKFFVKECRHLFTRNKSWTTEITIEK